LKSEAFSKFQISQLTNSIRKGKLFQVFSLKLGVSINQKIILRAPFLQLGYHSEKHLKVSCNQILPFGISAETGAKIIMV
jgi:hypothetical protein